MYIILPFWLGLASAVIGEFALTRVVKGKKDATNDHGTFWLVWCSWNIAILVNVALFFIFNERGEWPGWIALPGCILAVGLRVYSKKILGRFYTMTINIQDNHKLITDGPYRYLRHPLYAGFGAFFLLWPLTHSNPDAVLWGEALGGIPVFIALMVRINYEELALNNHFASAWEDYSRRTKKLIPFIY